jgi:hypothetical protein
VWREKPQIWQVATRLSGSSWRKLGQPLVEQKMRPAAADEAEAALVRRRIRRMDPARAEVEWVMVRESMVSCDSRVSRGRLSSGADPIGRPVRWMRGTRAVLVCGAGRVAGAESEML